MNLLLKFALYFFSPISESGGRRLVPVISMATERLDSAIFGNEDRLLNDKLSDPPVSLLLPS